MNTEQATAKLDEMLLNAQIGRSYWNGRAEALADLKKALSETPSKESAQSEAPANQPQ